MATPVLILRGIRLAFGGTPLLDGAELMVSPGEALCLIGRNASAGADWGNVVQFTIYLVHSQSIPDFMAFRLREFPRMFADGRYPPNTLLIVDRLVQEPFLVEVQTVAAI